MAGIDVAKAHVDAAVLGAELGVQCFENEASSALGSGSGA